MNARLKQLAQQRGYDLEKIASLIDLYEGDEALVEQMLAGRIKSHDDQHLLKVAYKAVEPEAELVVNDDELTLSAADLDAIGKVVAAALRQATPAKAPAKLTDSGRMSSMPSTKAYQPARDLFAIAVGADQVRQRPAPVVTKAAKSAPSVGSGEHLKALISGALDAAARNGGIH